MHNWADCTEQYKLEIEKQSQEQFDSCKKHHFNAKGINVGFYVSTALKIWNKVNSDSADQLQICVICMSYICS